jgi:hypothetical protein
MEPEEATMPKITNATGPSVAVADAEAPAVTDESAVAGRQEGEPRDDTPAAPSDQPDDGDPGDDPQDGEDADEPVEAVRPKPSDSRGDWEAYARLLGVPDEQIVSARTKADLQACCDQLQADSNRAPS